MFRPLPKLCQNMGGNKFSRTGDFLKWVKSRRRRKKKKEKKRSGSKAKDGEKRGERERKRD